MDELLTAYKSLVGEYCEYQVINNLGDPEKQHNIKWARKFIPHEPYPAVWYETAKRNLHP